MNLDNAKQRATITGYRLKHAVRDGLYKGLMATPLKHAVTKAMKSDWRQKIDQKKVIAQQQKYGTQSPMLAEDKQATIIDYGKRFHISTLVETGTYLGHMVEATKNVFQTIYSVELDQALFEAAKKKFADDHHITILQGDSARVLPEILAKISTPALFWLDGHYSGNETALGDLQTPVLAEVSHILKHHVKGHVILIDDARCFIGTGDYPTLEKLQQFINSLMPGLTFEVNGDIIRIFQAQTI